MEAKNSRREKRYLSAFATELLICRKGKGSSPTLRARADPSASTPGLERSGGVNGSKRQPPRSTVELRMNDACSILRDEELGSFETRALTGPPPVSTAASGAFWFNTAETWQAEFAPSASSPYSASSCVRKIRLNRSRSTVATTKPEKRTNSLRLPGDLSRLVGRAGLEPATRPL